MRYLILGLYLFAAGAILVSMVGCTTPSKAELYEYECAILTMHGVQAKFIGLFPSEVAAEREAEYIRQQLVEKELVSENTGVMCYLKGKK